MPLGGVPFFACVVSRGRGAAQRGKLQGDVFQLKWGPHAEFQLIWSRGKTTKIVTYPLLWLASSIVYCKWVLANLML